ncbi:MAG: ATP-binding protein [Lachnospiraceae bacterium]|nr:ATP-binding protein [Lachnospiraceae bacterium]
MDNFTREVPTYRGMFITGVRGSGKTVMLGDIRNKIAEQDRWLTVDINPESNLLDSLARKLYLIPMVKAMFIKAKLDFSVLGIGVHLENAELMASDEEDAIEMMLRVLKKSGYKILVTIDEVTYSKGVAKLSHALSSYAGAGYDIYLLMTGLIENINNIKNKKSLTFLYRAKINKLDTLNITAIWSDYQKTLGLDREDAEKLAYMTRGYPLAFQAVGYLYWNELCKHEKFDDINQDEVDEKLDVILAELAYDKIWDELSQNDVKILYVMCRISSSSKTELIKVEDIRNAINMTSDSFTTYRKRLIEAGIVDGRQYGHLKFMLPRFENYIELKSSFNPADIR